MPSRITNLKNTWITKLYTAALMLAVQIFPAHAQHDSALQAGLIPHRALYDIKLSSKKSSSNVANISGKMLYEWYPACDAWITNHQFEIRYEYMEMPAADITSDFSTYESFDGKSFNFTSQKKKDDAVFEEIRGSVATNGTSYPNEIIYSIPEDLVLNMPEGTLFPMAHTLSVLEKIKGNRKFYNATIFDGSDEKGIVDVNSFVGKEVTYSTLEGYEKYKEHINQDLVNTKAWSVRLAFFPMDTMEPTADYEMSMVFHENGIISKMEINYDDFSIIQNLIALEPLESKCDTGIND